ncbi:WYL domain-containing protein [Methanocaldococcus fervens]|uniref:WYL domain-containing protein n=1 Tax=Methanocaldococcus fervens (strain DSM 4213 / JCM 15782 / AG86) TaxID=573064 RepID=C7P8D4_METFA|nr:WYL domain-containing protein [Methanocaldococcus fervens]ACV24816.1 hypothetical protein Mefer_0998 [Methanocaldococcus fervens AG86]
MDEIDEIICKAIKEMRRLKINYKGEDWRIIEPHCFGCDRKGNKKLRAYQVSGYSESGNSEGWKLFNVDEIRKIEPLNERFNEPRPKYNPYGDKHIPNVICKI